MALFKKKGENLSRAGAILDGLAPKENVEGADVTAEQEAAATAAAQAIIDAAASENTPPEGAEAPEGSEAPEGVEGAEAPEGGVATPPEGVEIPPVAPQVTEITDDLIFNKLSEMLGREVKSADDLKVETPQVDPEVAQLLEWKEKTGLSLAEFSNYTKDFSKMGDMDVAREILGQKYPNFTEEELNYSLANYVYDAEVDDEGDKIRKSIELKKFAQEGREALEANKLQLIADKPVATLTQEQQDAIALAQQVQQSRVSAQQTQQAYNDGIAQASTSLDSIDMKLTDDLTIKYNVPVEVKKNLPKMVAEMPHWYNEDGSYNHANVVKDVAKVTNFEAMVKAAYEQGLAVGKEGQIKKGANITIDGVVQPTTQTASKSNVLDVVGKIAGSQSSGKLRFRTKKT